MAAETNLSLPLVEAASSRLLKAVSSGLKEQDLVAILKPYEQESGVLVVGA